MAHDVFISYSSKDKKAAEAVCAKLESDGIKCWIAPRDIPPSARYAQSIINGINASRLMIFIFSSHANDSEHVESEIDRAYNKRIPIIPLRIEDLPLSGSLEYYLSTAQWFDALPPLEEHLEKLPKVVRQLLNRDAAEIKEAPLRTAPARLEPQSQKQKLFSSTAVKLIAGLVIIGIIAAGVILWFLPEKKTESQEVRSDNTPATTSNNPITSTDEIIVDSRSKLMWTKTDNGSDITWSDAIKYCENLSLNGFNDWRLPSVLDLRATNDSDISESDKIWKSFNLKLPCCYWTSIEDKQNQNHAMAYNLTSEKHSLAKADKEEMRALCVHHSER